MRLEQFQLGSALNDLKAAIRRYHVLLPPPLSMLLRVLIILEGTGRLLAPRFNLVEVLESHQRTLALKRVAPRTILRKLFNSARDWDDLIRGLPRQLSNLFRMANRQELGIQLLHRHLEPSVNRLVFGLMVSALFVGSSWLWAAKAPPLIWDTSVFGFLGCFAGLVFGYRLFRAIQHSGRLEEPEQPER